MKSKIPFFYYIVPEILIIGVIVLIFTQTSWFAKGGDWFGSMVSQDYVNKVNKAIRKMSVEVEEFDRPGYRAENQRELEEAKKLKEQIDQARKPKPGSYAKEPLVIADFTDLDRSPKILAGNSPGAVVSFAIAPRGKAAEAKTAARLLIDDIGKSERGKPYGSGEIQFSQPVEVGELQAIEVTVKAVGGHGFGIGLRSNKENGWLRWGAMRSGLTGENWTTFIIPLGEFNVWRFNQAKKRYEKPAQWMKPEKINSINFYFTPKHLDNGKSGTLWIEKVSLR